MYIVEWYNQDGELQQRTFDTQEAAWAEAKKLEEAGFGPVGVLWQTEV